MQYKEIQQDLFELPLDYTLAHCIAADAKMGAGIAVEFVRRNPQMRFILRNMNMHVGDVRVYRQSLKHHAVLNLITKEKSNTKPTRKDFNATILELKSVVQNLGITKLGIPKIGSGLDKLNWVESKTFIQDVFKDVDIEIIVCYL